MKEQINLISTVSKKDISLQKMKKKVQFFSYLFLILFLVLSGVIYFLFLSTNKILAGNQSKINQLKADIQKYHKTESYLVTITNRIDLIGKLLISRTSYIKSISDLKAILIPEFVPLSLKIGSDGGMTISGDCLGEGALAKFNETVRKVFVEGKYSLVFYPSITRSGDKKYAITLGVKI